MTKLHHPNIVLLMGVSDDVAADGGRQICIVAELMSNVSLSLRVTSAGGTAHRSPCPPAQSTDERAPPLQGSLRDVLASTRWSTSTRLLLRLVAHAARGLAFLHGRKRPIVHRDVKSPNVLISAEWHVGAAPRRPRSAMRASASLRELLTRLPAPLPQDRQGGRLRPQRERGVRGAIKGARGGARCLAALVRVACAALQRAVQPTALRRRSLAGRRPRRCLGSGSCRLPTCTRSRLCCGSASRADFRSSPARLGSITQRCCPATGPQCLQSAGARASRRSPQRRACSR